MVFDRPGSLESLCPQGLGSSNLPLGALAFINYQHSPRLVLNKDARLLKASGGRDQELDVSFKKGADLAREIAVALI